MITARTVYLTIAAIASCAVSARAAASTSPSPEDTHYTMTTWTGRDGMPSSFVLSMVQDPDGYLWIGTNAGLARFDGQRFVSWPRAGAFPSPNPVVFAICFARDSSLWAAFGGPSTVVRDHNGQIAVYTSRDGLPDGGIRVLQARRDGSVWAGGPGGLAAYRDGRWRRIPVSGAPDTAITGLFEDSGGGLWVATDDGVFRQDPGSDVLRRVYSGFKGPVSFDERAGTTVMVGDSRIVQLRADGSEPHAELLASGSLTGPYRILIDSRGQQWVGSSGQGLFLIGPQRTPVRLDERKGLAGDLVRAILEDDEGNIWVGTQAGLTRVSAATITSAPMPAGMTTESIWMLVADREGSVWANAQDGLVRFWKGGRTAFAHAGGATLTEITALHVDAGGTVWVASADGRLLRRSNGRFVPFTWSSHDRRPVRRIVTDRRGSIWLFDGEAFLVVDAGGRSMSRVEVPAEFRNTPMRFAHIDARGRLWIGVDGGTVAVYEAGAFRIFAEPDGVPLGNLSGIHEDFRGRIWISSDNGLLMWDGTRFVTFTTSNGLPGNRIAFVIEDETRHLWLGIGSGLLRIGLDEFDTALQTPGHRLRYRMYDASDGLHGTPVRRGTPNVASTPDGTLWFGTSVGISIVDPARLARDRPLRAPRIEDVVINGVRTQADSGLRVPSDTSSVQIEYTALSLSAPSKLRFRRRLDGIDRDWIDDVARQAAYAHLPPGTYTFRLSAGNGTGVWSEPTVWTFRVLPAWYQTW